MNTELSLLSPILSNRIIVLDIFLELCFSSHENKTIRKESTSSKKFDPLSRFLLRAQAQSAWTMM
jgi:hypothetical protein